MFKAGGASQSLMASALNVPVTVMETAGEGGAWGIAVLAAYARQRGPGETLDEYLGNKVFAASSGFTAEPKAEDTQGFRAFMDRYRRGLLIERAAIEQMK
jgi:sugar (pentulose or hexulose) kinase